jgi:hypothetical protein
LYIKKRIYIKGENDYIQDIKQFAVSKHKWIFITGENDYIQDIKQFVISKQNGFIEKGRKIISRISSNLLYLRNKDLWNRTIQRKVISRISRSFVVSKQRGFLERDNVKRKVK